MHCVNVHRTRKGRHEADGGVWRDRHDIYTAEAFDFNLNKMRNVSCPQRYLCHVILFVTRSHDETQIVRRAHQKIEICLKLLPCVSFIVFIRHALASHYTLYSSILRVVFLCRPLPYSHSVSAAMLSHDVIDTSQRKRLTRKKLSENKIREMTGKRLAEAISDDVLRWEHVILRMMI